jgi:type III pantothenate kinase
MLLVIDVGNTNTVLGVFERVPSRPGEDLTAEPARYERLIANWRVGSHLARTVDEYGVIFRNLFSMENLEVSGVHGIVISSVVPPLDSALRQVCERYFNTKPLFVEPGVKTGMQVLYDNPAEVGADRIVNGVAAFEKYGGPCIIVDFGTATTFDCISKKGEYMGGVICPGIGISADALFQRTARLPRVEIRKPARVIGSNTVGSLQSGLYYGYLGLVDGILERLVDELGSETQVIATGGLGSLLGTASHFIKNVDEFLTLEGLRIIWDRNHSFRREAVPKVAKSTPQASDKPSNVNADAKPWPSPKTQKTK